MTHRPLILVAEDNPDLRAVLGMLLEHHGFRVSRAANGEEAVAEVGRATPDLILMDLMMPKMDGYTAAAALKHNGGQDIPIVAVTARAADRSELLNRGFCELLRKPVPAKELLATVRRLLDR